MVKNQPAMQETQVQSLGQKDPLEKGMTTLSSILAWRIPWTEKLGRLQSTGSQRVRHDWVTSLLDHLIHQGSPRILEWVTYPFSNGSSQSRNQTWVSCIAGWFFTIWATREVPKDHGNPLKVLKQKRHPVRLSLSITAGREQECSRIEAVQI